MSKFFNTTDSSVVVDDDGHVVDGLGWHDGKETDQVKHLVEQGFMVPVEEAPASESGDTGEGASSNPPAAVEKSSKTKRQ